MRRTLTCIAGAAALALPLPACGSTGSGDSAAKGGCGTPTSTIAVQAFDRLQFDADTFNASAGCIGVQYTNAGTLAHTLLVKGQKGFKLSIGKSASGSIELSAGTYRLYCDLPGHEAAGMHAELIVT
jgi:plastocyanin